MPKPRFNPNADFEVVDKPKFDPSKPFESDEAAPPAEPSELGADLRAIASGVIAGFDDEVQGGLGAAGRVAGVKNLGSWKPFDPNSHLEYDSPTLDKSELVKAYIANRDAAMVDKGQDFQNFPGRVAIGNVGGALLSPVSKLGLLGGGAAFGLGDSNADLTQGDYAGAAKDAAKGAATAGVIGAALPLAVKGVQKASEYVPSILGRAGRIASGADADALARQYSRPTESSAAEADSFGHEVSGSVMDAIESKGRQAGEGVGRAEKQFMKGYGQSPFSEAKDLGEKIQGFLEANRPSPKGFSALSPKQSSELSDMAITLNNGTATGEDILKFRKYLDHVEDLASQYDKDGSSPYIRFLKEIRHDADQVIDRTDPRFDVANKGFSQYKNDSGLLRGATRDSTAESFVNNLYSGANKGAAKDAADRLLGDRPELLEQMKDIAANKSIAKIGPAGSEQGLRNIAKVGGAIGLHGLGVPLPVIAAGEALMSPKTWKYGLRGLGTVAQQLGKYGPVLESAASRGPAALAATQGVLMKDPDYVRTLQQIDADSINRKVSNE